MCDQRHCRVLFSLHDADRHDCRRLEALKFLCWSKSLESKISTTANDMEYTR